MMDLNVENEIAAAAAAAAAFAAYGSVRKHRTYGSTRVIVALIKNATECHFYQK
ncbi:predicted protein [Histoplasma mississippiense (nom. inval.)]|uniref:predicted protein n=1 Tax=Ajellomyces capsulatus (strain NAm1 / WU24) TaxID=2059318 RepID=UPI000157BF29|nr:predicted protein [Histoplasma mississippiense (nom. inval.)]EDN06767.1 predicted protein [Histoplasma mississippiense (nom. inval.)]